MKNSIFLLSALIFLTDCNPKQNKEFAETEKTTDNYDSVSANLLQYNEHTFDSICFEWGEKRNIELKNDSLLYFTLQRPTVLKYVTKTEHDFVNKTDFKHIVAYQKKIDSAFHFCFNLNTKKLALIDITAKLPKSEEKLFLDSIEEQIKSEIKMGGTEVLRYCSSCDTFIIRYFKDITKHDEKHHKYKIDLSTENYPHLGFYHRGVITPIPHTFDGYLTNIYYWDSLECGIIRYSKRGETFSTFIRQGVFDTIPVKLPWYIGYIHTFDCKTYWAFNQYSLSRINEFGEVVEVHRYKL